MTTLSPVGFDSTARKHIIASPGDYLDPQYTHIPVTSGTGALASVVGAPTFYTDTTTGNKYYRDALGVVVQTSHSTSNSTCPATGPTVAPTAEGHYYWTSTLGEIWCWIYGDASPFVVGKFYRHTQTTTPNVVAPHNTYVQGLATPAVPRTGIISVTSYLQIRNNLSGSLQNTSNLRVNGVIIPYRFDSDVGAQTIGNATLTVATYESIPVVAGDILSVWGSQSSSSGSSSALIEYVNLSYMYRG